MLAVAAISTGPADRGLDAALAEATPAVGAAAGRGADLVVLPEIFARPYVADDDPRRWTDLAEPIDGPTASWAATMAHRHGIAIVFGVALADGGSSPLNAALLARPDCTLELLAAKANLPPSTAGGFGEPDHFRPGRLGPRVAAVGDARVGAIVCYDRRYPESWRALAAAEADVAAVLVAGPAPDDPPGIFEAELRTHARANALYVAVASRAGTERILGRPVRHDGATLTVDPEGQIRDRAAARPGEAAWLVVADGGCAARRALYARRAAGRTVYARRPERNER